MTEWLWGTEWIAALQSSGGTVFAEVMKSFSFVGSELFYLLVMPAILWCVDSRLGIRTGVLLLSTSSLTAILKVAFGLPRPFWVDGRIVAPQPESSFGLPSGHAQTAVVVWGYLAYRIRRWWMTAAAVVLILGISFSRPYLGVHFAADVLAGWVIGGLLLIGFILFEDRAARWLRRQSLGARLGVVAAGALGLLAAGLIVSSVVADRPIPPEWIENYLRAVPPGEAFEAALPASVIPAAGALLGFAVGAVLLDAWGRFDARSGGGSRRAARFVVGVVGTLALFIGLSRVLPEGESFRYLRYALVGFWISYGAPRAFVALRLT